MLSIWGSLQVSYFEKELKEDFFFQNLVSMKILPLPNRILDWLKLKAFADISNVAQNNDGICFSGSRKHSGKRSKCWFPELSPFPTVFSKAHYVRIVETWVCVVKS